MRNILVILFTVCCVSAFSQGTNTITAKDPTGAKPKKEKKAKEPKLRIPDSLYYSKYNSSIILGYFGSTKGYHLDINQYLNNDTSRKSALKYIAESNWVDGIEFMYDKLSFTIGYKSTPPQNKSKKGETKFFNFGFNLGGNKWIIEANYRNYKGFYENNTVTYDTSFKTTGIYYNSPIKSELYKLKFMYFTNHKRFAFRSCYSSSYRQRKSSFTWIITGNAYYNTLKSDSSIIPMKVRDLYGDQGGLKGLNVFAFSVYGGASLNLVMFRHLIFNITYMLGPEAQFRTYRYDTLQTRDLTYIKFSSDFRAAIGLNYRKFYTFASFTGDITPYKSSQMLVQSTYYTVNFAVGFRIHTGYPKWYQKIQRTKLYQML